MLEYQKRRAVATIFGAAMRKKKDPPSETDNGSFAVLRENYSATTVYQTSPLDCVSETTL